MSGARAHEVVLSLERCDAIVKPCDVVLESFFPRFVLADAFADLVRFLLCTSRLTEMLERATVVMLHCGERSPPLHMALLDKEPFSKARSISTHTLELGACLARGFLELVESAGDKSIVILDLRNNPIQTRPKARYPFPERRHHLED